MHSFSSSAQRLCAECGAAFLALRSNQTNQRFCSRQCAYAYRVRPVEERFWAKVLKSEGCWIWTAATNGAGYGRLGRGRAGVIAAHRLSWQIHYEPVSAGLFVCHRCDNPICVRPDHLFLGTAADNMADRSAKGRAPTGTAVAGAKLNPEAVQAIRLGHAGGRAQRDLAEEFGVGPSTIGRVLRGENWTHGESRAAARAAAAVLR